MATTRLRQRTSVLVAFCRPFDVLLVDEPFVGLDAAGIALPGHGPLVMATYAVGQLLIATGWVAMTRSIPRSC
mgnify:CR=1 FL=1